MEKSCLHRATKEVISPGFISPRSTTKALRGYADAYPRPWCHSHGAGFEGMNNARVVGSKRLPPDFKGMSGRPDNV
jgi:hypothetical protein